MEAALFSTLPHRWEIIFLFVFFRDDGKTVKMFSFEDRE